MTIALLALILIALVLPGFMRFVGWLKLLFVFAVIVQVGNAKAASIPLYDVDAACRKQIGKDAGVNYCIAVEQEAYETINLMWPSMLDDEQQSCTSKAMGQPMWKYVFLRSCLQASYDRRIINTPQSFQP